MSEPVSHGLKELADRPYRLGVGIVLFNQQGLVFVGRRKDTAEPAWQFPQGGIDKGEEPQEAAWREMLEEIGTNNAELIAQSKEWFTYELPPAMANKSWGGKYRGQKQLWFAFRYKGQDYDINLNAHTPEFSVWRWIELSQVVDHIVEFKRPLYQHVVAEFLPLAQKTP